MKFSTSSVAALAAFGAVVNAFPTDSSLIATRDAEAKSLLPKLPSRLTRQEMMAIGRRDAEAEAKTVKLPSKLPGMGLTRQEMMVIGRREAEPRNVRIPGKMPKLGRREAIELTRPRFRIGVVERPKQARDVSSFDGDLEDTLQLRDALMKTRIGMVVNNRQKRDLESYEADLEDMLLAREAFKPKMGTMKFNQRDLEDILSAREAFSIVKPKQTFGMRKESKRSLDSFDADFDFDY